MNKQAKAILIPIAAFAVTVSGAYAFNSDVLEKAGLSDSQIEAFEEARELREDGDKEAARDVLVDAGIDMETMQQVREAVKEERQAMKTAIDEVLETGDYNDFVEVIADSPLSDIITSEDDYELFKEAHELREAGDHDAAHEIMEELGFSVRPEGFGPGHEHGPRSFHGAGMGGRMEEME